MNSKHIPLAVLPVLLTIATVAEPLDRWHWRNPQPALNTLLSVAYGGGQFVAVGLLGTVSTSSDGLHWTSPPSQTPSHLNGVTYGDGTFVAVGGPGSSGLGEGGTILTSQDGTNWTERPSGTTSTLGAVAYGNGTFVAWIETNGREFLTSTNGREWARHISEAPQRFRAIAYANGTFVAVGDQGPILTSTDGIDWISHDIGMHGDFYSLAYGNGTFVAVGILGTTWTSPDGATWTMRRPADSTHFYTLTGVTFASGLFVAVGDDGSIETSTDGVIWNQSRGLAKFTLNAVAYGNGLFVAVGRDGVVVTSNDLATWPLRLQGSLETLWAVTYGGGNFVAVGDAGTILTSVEGKEWVMSSSGSSVQLRSVAYGGGLFLAVGEGGTILTSPDAVSWTARESGTTNDLYGITYGNGFFVAVGDGIILRSTNVIDWKGARRDTAGEVVGAVGIGYGNGMFVAAGYDRFYPRIWTSTDGVNWTPRPIEGSIAGFISWSAAVAFGYGRFVVAGGFWEDVDDLYGGLLWTSTNAMDWTKAPAYSTALDAVGLGNGTFLAAGRGCFRCVGPEAPLISSITGTNWTERQCRTIRGLFGVTYGKGTFVLVGEYGAILQSDPFPPRLEVLLNPAQRSLAFNLFGEAGEHYRIEVSSDLTTWSTLTDFISATGTNQFADPAASAFSRRFYRAVTP